MDFHNEDIRLSDLAVPSIPKLHETTNNQTDMSGVFHTYFHIEQILLEVGELQKLIWAQVKVESCPKL